MTRAVRDRVLKEANGNISDHLRNHIHLTNCIHLKNHMHRHSPILADRSLMRDLIVLQRSRSLRDPSTSPPSWPSPSIVDLLSRKGEKDAVSGRRSIGGDRRREGRRLSGSSPPVSNIATSKVAPGDISRGVSGVDRENRREESSGKHGGVVHEFVFGSNQEPGQHGNGMVHDFVSKNLEPKDQKTKQRGKQKNQDIQCKTLSQQLYEVPLDSDDAASASHSHFHKEPESSIRGSYSGLNRVKRRKFKTGRRTRVNISSRDAGARNELSVASNSLAQVSNCPKYQMQEGGEDDYADQNVTRAPKNGCGIPFNWSRIHHRGRTFLDIAGRSLSCGLSDSRLKKGAPGPNCRDASDIPAITHSHSSSKSDAEALPLLVGASGSQESTENAAWVHDYSGELGIFADNLLKNDIDSDLASEARSVSQRKHRKYSHRMHQNLTEKYMPRTFGDIVGQNLVAQALSNAIIKRKVGLLYVFYGPHGTGKTSCARIFARALNCHSLEHPKPCGVCNSCCQHEIGKSRNIKEIGPVSNFDFESIMDLLDNMAVVNSASQYRVFIFDDCDTLSSDCWSAMSKVIDRAPRRVLFVLVSSNLDVVPHIIISRCQKFFFPKLKDADIVYTLQWIAAKENLEVDKEALKLIASRSDGSLRDAEMTLDQLSLLGQRISVPLVQEMVGLISDDKLVDLLDLALSADTVNTVKNLREIMEAGVEPLALMSQLATVITDILAGSFDFTKGRLRRKFFRRQPLSKEDMEKLRQALKTLSEAEKQLRVSNDKLTWLTAALLQLAPDQQYILPHSSAETSFHHSPLTLKSEIARKSSVVHADMVNNERGLPTNSRTNNLHVKSSDDVSKNSKMKGLSINRNRLVGSGMPFQQTATPSADANQGNSRQDVAKRRKEIEEIWLDVLEKLQINSIREFMCREGKLVSVSLGAAPTVQLMFTSQLNKSKAEKFRGQILHAFELVLGSPVTIEIRCEPRKDNNNDSKRISTDSNVSGSTLAPLHAETQEMGKSEIVEVHNNNTQLSRSNMASIPERRKPAEQCQSIVRGKVSLAHVIQQVEGCKQRSGWSKHKAVSIAAKLEQENLRLEPRSRSLFCWKASRVTRRKLSRLKIRGRRPHTLLKLVSCGRCLSAKSSR